MTPHPTNHSLPLLLTILLMSTIWLCTSCRTPATSTATSTAHTTTTTTDSDTLTVAASTNTSHLTTDTLTVTAAAMEQLAVTFAADTTASATLHPDGTLTLRGLHSLRRDRTSNASLTYAHQEAESANAAVAAASSSHVATGAAEETSTETTNPTPLSTFPRWPFLLVSLLAGAAIALWLLHRRF